MKTPSPPKVELADLDRAISAVENPEAIPDAALAWASYPYFLTLLRDDKGQPLQVPWHIEEWATLMQNERLLALLAARDHGKTWTAWGYILWRCWRHNRAPDGALLISYGDDGTVHLPEGVFEFTYVTSIKPLSIERFGRIQQMMLDNIHLFGDILPRREPGQALAVLKDQWAKTNFRLRNGAMGSARSVGSSTRGLHPDLIVADDIVEIKNALTELQRNRVWAYVVSTLQPMAGKTGQMIVIGTPQHYEDALFRLKGKPNWRWVKFRAVDFDSGIALWPERYSVADLLAIQKTDVIIFSREYQMDPRDDAASIFPRSLTAKAFREDLRYVYPLRPTQITSGEFVVLGGDVALSESTGADYSVYMVVLYNRFTQKRRLLYAVRKRGMTFREQVNELRTLCKDLTIHLGVVEQNGFQRWLHQELAQYPETNARIFGHNTGIEKQQVVDGIPGLKLILEHGLWEIPYSEDDPDAREFATVWQNELNAFGWAEGKLQGVGAHDDVVMAMWFVERAIRMIESFRTEGSEVITAEELLDVERVQIGAY